MNPFVDFCGIDHSSRKYSVQSVWSEVKLLFDIVLVDENLSSVDPGLHLVDV